MKEKRYYYISPIAAAWMSKNFGMVITYANQNVMTASEFGHCVTNIMESYEFNSAPYYIASESVGLLEAQPGDLLTGRNRKAFMFYDEEITPNGNARIAERDGIQFFWPEVEE